MSQYGSSFLSATEGHLTFFFSVLDMLGVMLAVICLKRYLRLLTLFFNSLSSSMCWKMSLYSVDLSICNLGTIRTPALFLNTNVPSFWLLKLSLNFRFEMFGSLGVKASFNGFIV